MAAIIDLWYDTKNRPPREKIVGVARFFLGTPYDYGSKSARPLDGISGQPQRKIDCSGFERAVYDEVFPQAGLACRDDLSALKFQTEDLLRDVDEPDAGDIVCWDHHIGIVCDPATGQFIGAQSSTGVMVASYKSGYWATTKPVKKFRFWKTL